MAEAEFQPSWHFSNLANSRGKPVAMVICPLLLVLVQRAQYSSTEWLLGVCFGFGTQFQWRRPQDYKRRAGTIARPASPKVLATPDLSQPWEAGT